MNARADRRRKNKSSSVRLAILAATSRVRCAALRELDGKAKPPERGKEAKLCDSIVAKEISIAPAAGLGIGQFRSLRWSWGGRFNYGRHCCCMVQPTISELSIMMIEM